MYFTHGSYISELTERNKKEKKHNFIFFSLYRPVLFAYSCYIDSQNKVHPFSQTSCETYLVSGELWWTREDYVAKSTVK